MKCALVTGGSRGIGRAICIRMAALGYYILVNYKSNIEEANKTISLIRQGGGGGELLQFDVADKHNVQQVLGKWLADNEEKYIEVLVNNAGIRDDSLMAWMADEQWDNVLKTNLDSFFLCYPFGVKHYANPEIRAHHQCGFALRLKRISRANQLFRSQSRCDRRDKSPRPGSWPAGNNCKCFSAWFY